VSIFKSVYAKNTDVFVAIPSLYSVCPVIVLFYTVENRSGVFNLASLAIMLGIWFAAAYISHHMYWTYWTVLLRPWWVLPCGGGGWPKAQLSTAF